MKFWAILFFGVLTAAGPVSAQSAAAIQKLNNAWSSAFNRGDAAQVAAMYTEDAYVLPAGHDMVKGRAAIEAFWKEQIQQIGNAKLTALDVMPLGPRAAREIGLFAFETKAQPPQPVAGKYVVVWRRIGNKWLLATDIWNMNK